MSAWEVKSAAANFCQARWRCLHPLPAVALLHNARANVFVAQRYSRGSSAKRCPSSANGLNGVPNSPSLSQDTASQDVRAQGGTGVLDGRVQFQPPETKRLAARGSSVAWQEVHAGF